MFQSKEQPPPWDYVCVYRKMGSYVASAHVRPGIVPRTLYAAYCGVRQPVPQSPTGLPGAHMECNRRLMPQYVGVMYRMAKGDNPFKAPMATFETTDPKAFVAWVDRMEQQGYVEAAEHEQHISMLRFMSKKRQAELSKPYNPTPQEVAEQRANRPSGKGQKPMPRPTRDYKGTAMPKGQWTPIREKW